MYWIIKTDQQKEYRKPISTNESGAFLWEGIEERLGLKELTALVQKYYNIEREEAELDVRRFLTQLSRNGMETYLNEKGIYT